MDNGDHSSLTLLTLCLSVLQTFLRESSPVDFRSLVSCERDCEYISQRACKEGLPVLTVLLPSLGREFDRVISKPDGVFSPVGFQLHDGLPLFCGDLFRQVFGPDGRLLESPSPQAVRLIRQVAYLFYKLEVPYDKAVVAQKLDEFVELDGSLPCADEPLELSRDTAAAVDAARILIARVLDTSYRKKLQGENGYLTRSAWDPRDIIPRHGPGVVATGEKPWEKFRWRRWYKRLAEMYPYEDYFYYNYTHLLHNFRAYLGLHEEDTAVAKLAVVPKDSRGPRLISAEPLEIQWIQQGVGRALMARLEDHPYTKGCVNFTSQEVNRVLALMASRSGQFDTLDMKDASDRVSVWLVKALFGSRVAEYLLACRSDATKLPDGRTIPLRKFAPMGSAVCFPVESLVFWALCMGTLYPQHCWLGDPQTLTSDERCYVFGDDIIVPSGTYDRIRPIFEELHLKFNEQKCCTGKFFRESCGMDAFQGVSVTPIRIKHLGGTPEDLVSICAYANAFAHNGYRQTAEILFAHVETSYGPLPYSTGKLALSRHIDTDEAAALRNFGLFKIRLNADLQILEYRTRQPIPDVISRPAPAWEEWLRLTTGRLRRPESQGFQPDSYSSLSLFGCKWTNGRGSIWTQRIAMPDDTALELGQYSVGRHTKLGVTWEPLL